MESEADIRMIISNHPDAGAAAAWWGLPFHHIPVTPQTMDVAETAQLSLPARAVGWHLEDRVIVHENRTIVFS
jgi:formyltetrahydrofolate deformylase